MSRLPHEFLREFRLYVIEERFLLGCNDLCMWVAVKPLRQRIDVQPSDQSELLRLAQHVGTEIYVIRREECLTGPVRRWRVEDRPGADIEQLLPERQGLIYAQMLVAWIKAGDHRWGHEVFEALELLMGTPIRRN